MLDVWPDNVELARLRPLTPGLAQEADEAVDRRRSPTDQRSPPSRAFDTGFPIESSPTVRVDVIRR